MEIKSNKGAHSIIPLENAEKDGAEIDRMWQQALVQILEPIFEPTFSDSSYGFRPKRNA